MQLPKTYTPKEYENDIYKKWEESGKLNPDNLKAEKDASSFVISMPPPNATGVLHVGHTLGIAVQDIMTRFNRMKGKRALLLPGTDHAAIATQNVVEKMLRKEGSSRHKLGREKFLERTQEYVEQNKATINNQTRKMGASCDWSREGYTMSEELTRAVGMQFKNMYNEGLIYRGDRIVNWCQRCHSTLADDEVEHKEQQGKLYYFKYSKDFPITIATTRPETKLGDTAVAVNNMDDRYADFVGQDYEIDFVGVPLKLKVIADPEVEAEFGTGALGVTPAHSQIDWKMAEDHKLEIKKVIGQDGKILDGFGEYSGMKVKEAREKVVENLRAKGLLEKEEDVQNNLSVCYRCGAAIEPLPSLQWFIAVDKKFQIKNSNLVKSFGKSEASLKELSLWAVKSGYIKIVPERFGKVYTHWMENLHDWCISRQIWFGHRIPVWYKTLKHKNTETQKQDSKIASYQENQKIYVGLTPPEGDDWTQDEDTLDTWFSSALWTWSTLLNKENFAKYETLEEWIANSPDIKNFHPTSVMETMHDILFFWVARMIMMTLYALGEVPFKNVYLHGMVQDKNGNKMSKSHPETCIEPIEISEKYGTDALRLSMIIGNTAGNNLRLSEQKIASFRNFANKLWNIGRFIQFQEEQNGFKATGKFEAKTTADKWILTRLNEVIGEVTDDLEKYRFSLAGEKLYDFTWHELADWYVEVVKIQNNENSYNLLFKVYNLLLKLLHPFTPFVTEKIYEYFGEGEMLMTEKWPVSDDKLIDEQAKVDFALLQEIVTAIRAWRKENGKDMKEILNIQIAGAVDLIEREKKVLNTLAKVSVIQKEQLDKVDLEVGNARISMHLPAGRQE